MRNQSNSGLATSGSGQPHVSTIHASYGGGGGGMDLHSDQYTTGAGYAAGGNGGAGVVVVDEYKGG